MSNEEKSSTALEEYYKTFNDSVRELKSDDPEISEYEKDLISKGCVVKKGKIPPLPPGYEIINGGSRLFLKDKSNNQIIGPLLEEDNIVSEGEFTFIIEPQEKQEWEQALKPIKNFSINQLDKLRKVLKNETGQLTREELVKSIEKVIGLHSNKDTFGLPSHALMFTLLAMFAGKPDKIPRKLLDKPHKEWTDEERKEAEVFLNSIISVEKNHSYLGGVEEIKENRIAIISDNPKVEAKAEISGNLFREDVLFREFSLAIYIKRTFGSEGLRHLLGFLIGLEENFRKGYFEWSVNEHLERLGYRKKPNGAYDPEIKKIASEIIKVFQSLFITAIKKEGKKEVIEGERLFSIDGFRQETFDKVIIDEKIKLRATDFWYKHAFEPEDGQSGKYTKLLKKIAQENHREHPLTIYLAPLLAIFWRMNPEKKISVRSLMDWCDLDHEGKYRQRDLRSLESELNYMKENGYLGKWNSSGEFPLPSDCEDPFNCNLTLIPPEWLEQELQLIIDKKEGLLPPEIEERILTLEEFREIFIHSKLSQNQFANTLGVSNALVSLILKGDRRITEEVSKKAKSLVNTH